MKKLIAVLLLIPLFNTNYTFAENKDSISLGNSILYEKVYLHIDRELYSPGDMVWFKSYLVSGINNQLIPGYKNIYIQLISDSGKVVYNKLLLSKDGTSFGDFQLSASLSDGTYVIRAHTKYQLNFGEESYFYKKIVVSRAKNSLELLTWDSIPKQKSIDVSFLPESGSFVQNAINHIAFKAINESGKGIEISGKVVDEKGNEIVSFQTNYKGMGKFIMMPQEGKSYFVLIDEFPDFNYQFEEARPDGICLNYKPDGNYLLFTLTRNLKINGAKDFILKASHKGIELFNSQITMTEFQHAQKLFKGLFPLGISKITLLDDKNNVVAERMVFVRNNNDNSIQIRVNKNEYKTREKVTLNISSFLSQADSINSTLSLAVVHEDYFSTGGNSQNIESYLLLDSELKGSIESPANSFIDEVNITADEKLDLLMMVNGWRSYYWNELEQYRGVELPDWADFGLSIKGNVSKQWGGKPVEEGKVVIGPFSKSFLIEQAITDNFGNFTFDKLYLKDSAVIMINAKTKNGSKRTNITLKPQLKYDLGVPIETLKNNCPDINIPMKFHRHNYYRQLSENEFSIKEGILLKEIKIEESRIVNGDGHFRLYSEPDLTFQITDEDHNYMSILDYLDGRAAGVHVIGETVSIRNSPNSPLLLIDGLEVDWSRVQEVSMGDVDKIEILKSGFSTVAYGSRGADGVIAVLTKMGKGEWENTFNRIIHGRITPRVRGFQQPKEFYSPKYTYLNINNPKPDYRPTLLWEPEVIIKNGKATVDFYTSDNLARYKVIVEGVSKNGKICLGTGLVSVSIPRN